MVNLVLQHATHEIVSLVGHRLAIETDTFGSSKLRSLDLPVPTGYGETALLVLPLARSGDYLRVDHHEWSLSDVRHEDALGDANLGSGESNTGCLIHGFQHIVDETAEIVVEPRDSWCLHCEDRVRERTNWEYRHGAKNRRPLRLTTDSGYG